MHILAVTQGQWGDRMVDNIQANGPLEWTVERFHAPRFLPPIVDDPDEFLPDDLPPADLILYLGENPHAAQLIPAIVRRCGAKAVLAPIDNSAWLPTGLKNQLQRELAEEGIASVFPKPFCSLTPESCNYRRAAQSYDNEIVAAFAQHFGRPQFKITVDPETKLITDVEVVRNSACGSARFVAQKLVGLSADSAEYEAGLFHHHYPCLASMQKEWIDDALEDTLMHVSGFILQEEVGSHVKPFKKPPEYFTPGEQVAAKVDGDDPQ